MQHLGFFVKDTADAVSTIFPHDRIVMRLAMILDDMTDVPERCARLYQGDCLVKAFLADPHQAIRMFRNFPYRKHLAGDAVKAILNNGDIDVYNISGFEYFFVAGDAVADDMIY